MTHRRMLELAGLIAENAESIARQCRGIRATALRAYLKAWQHQCDVWSEQLNQCPAVVGCHRSSLTSPTTDELRQTLQAIATSAILIRVFSTMLHAIGQRIDIPLAMDVALQTARIHDKIVQRAMGLVAVGVELSSSELAALDRLGRSTDRLVDLLCGAMIPPLGSDRFAVDGERAKDFAETFGREPALVRVAIQKAVQFLPYAMQSVGDTTEVERTLVSCLPILGNLPALKGLKDRSNAQPSEPCATGRKRPGADVILHCETGPVAFPTHSFVRSRQRLTGSTRE